MDNFDLQLLNSLGMANQHTHMDAYKILSGYQQLTMHLHQALNNL